MYKALAIESFAIGDDIGFVAINRRMQEVGVEKYYEEVKDLPRYYFITSFLCFIPVPVHKC